MVAGTVLAAGAWTELLGAPGIRMKRAALIGAALLATAGTIALATMLISATGGGGGGDADGAKQASSAVMTVDLPSGWEPSRVSGTGGMALTGTVGASSPRDHVRLVAGLARDHAQVRRVVGAAAATGVRRRAVDLGAIDARRWEPVDIGGDTAATLFVAYTSRGPLVAVCRGGSCSAVLKTIRLTGPRPVALSAIERVRRGFRSALLTLREQRTAGRRAIAAATVADEQANAAKSLELSFRFASRTLAAIPTPPGTTDLSGVVAALDATANAYGQLGDAISSGDSAGYDVARSEVIARERIVDSEVGAVEIP